MRALSLAALTVVVVAVSAGCGKTTTLTTTVTLPATRAKTGVGPPGRLLQFGYIKSLTRQGAGFRMRFDPAWLLSGVTANVAAAEDGAVEPGEPVPNDHYTIDEGHRLLTYLVPADARVRVLTSGSALGGSPITVAQLSRIVNGTSKLKLFEPISTGFWILVDSDTVRSLDQQYKP